MTQLKIKIKKSKLIRKIEGEKVTGYYGRVVSTGKKTFEEVAMESAKNTTLHEAEAKLAANLLLDGIRDRLGAKRFKKCIEKATATMREIRRKERVRLHWGLPQQTRLRISYNGYTETQKKRASHRHLFRKHGYYVDYGDNTVYYDNETDRRPKMEANAHKWGLTVEEWRD